MKTYRLIVFLLVFSIFGSCQSVKNKSESVPYIYSGRVDVSQPQFPKLIGPAAALEFNFRGNSISLSLKNSPFQGYYNYISVEIDGQYQGRYKVDNSDFKVFTLNVADVSKKVHDIKIVKATEAAMGEIVIDISSIATVPFSLTNRKKIEFIGDSITCGFGNDESGLPCGQGQWFDQHNAYFSYAAILSRNLNADFVLSSVSGYGMYRNWNSEKWEEDILPDVYDYLYLRRNEPLKYGDEFQPNLVSICLGTNDLSDGDGKKERLPFNKYKYIGNYIELIQKIYKKYPHTRIVLLTSPMVNGEKNKVFVDCLEKVKDFFKNDKIHQPIELFEFTSISPKGCGYHPDIKNAQEMASQLESTFKKLLNE